MTEKALKKPDVLSIMAQKYDLGSTDFLNTLKATVMKADKNGKTPSNEEVAAFLLVAKKYNLNPFTNEIYAFPDKRAGIIPIVGVDGFISLANRQPNFDGYDITWAEEKADLKDAKPCPEWCEIRVYRKDREHPTVVREYLDEVYQPPRSGYSGPWQSHTRRMLRHKTLIQGFRVAFGFTGIYDEDEAHRIVEANVIDVKATGKPEVALPESIEPEPIEEDARAEVINLAKKVWPESKKKFEDWLHAKFQTINIDDLSPEKLNIALSLIRDMADNQQ